MNDWKYVAVNYEAPGYRTGWIGVWDSIKSAVRGDKRPLVDHPYSISLWIKHNDAGITSNREEVKEKEVYINNVLIRKNDE